MNDDGPTPLRLLTITAHPHDVTYTLGTSAHHVERGDSVTVVSLSDGVTTHDEELEDEMRKPAEERRAEILQRPRSEQAERKQAELQRVCALFGIEDARVLPFADHPLDSSPQLMEALTDIFYEVRPHVVITHAPYNYPRRNMFSLWDGDHPLAGQLVQQAMQRVAQPDRRRERSLHQVAQVYFIGVEFGWTDIDLFVDISDQVARRIEAEALYETQGAQPAVFAQADRVLCRIPRLVRPHGVRRAVHQAERADQRLPHRHRQRSQAGGDDRQGESRSDGAVRQRRSVGIVLILDWWQHQRHFFRCWSCGRSYGARGRCGGSSLRGDSSLTENPQKDLSLSDSLSFEVVGMIS